MLIFKYTHTVLSQICLMFILNSRSRAHIFGYINASSLYLYAFILFTYLGFNCAIYSFAFSRYELGRALVKILEYRCSLISHPQYAATYYKFLNAINNQYFFCTFSDC